MPISGNVPNHLVVGARTGFLTGIKAADLPYRKIAGVVDAKARTLDMTDIGASPMPLEGTPKIQDFAERALSVKSRDWSTVTKVSYNALQYDLTGEVGPKAQGAGERFQVHMNSLVFKALNAGDLTTYGVTYDGLSLFNDAHVDKGASYLTTQDNKFALALTLDNFNTAMGSAAAFRDGAGEFTEYSYNLLVVPPALRSIAAQIVGNPNDNSTANNAINPYYGQLSYVVSPHLDSTAWMVLSTEQTAKPIYMAMWEQPNLQDAWFDPMGADGGMHYFKFYARYSTFAGDWRLAFMGNT